MEGSARSQARYCVTCGRSIDWTAMKCPYCGHDYGQGISLYERSQISPSAIQYKSHINLPLDGTGGTALPMIGGLLILVGGLACIVFGVMYFSMGNFPMSSLFGGNPFEDILEICGTGLIIGGIFGILSGSLAIMRRSFPMVVVGGVLSGFTIVSIIGVALCALSRNEFERK